MNISGNGRDWWHNAAGSYARGRAPERGAVLAFPGSGGMWRGHVAVVSRVVDDRTILIDHANWGGPGVRRGTVMRNVRVVDASDRNDWTAVRVQVGWDSSNFGRTYPTYGFIYNRRHDGTVVASAAGMREVAEAPSPHVTQHLRLAETLGR
jgi:surface antigen